MLSPLSAVSAMPEAAVPESMVRSGELGLLPFRQVSHTVTEEATDLVERIVLASVAEGSELCGKVGVVPLSLKRRLLRYFVVLRVTPPNSEHPTHRLVRAAELRKKWGITRSWKLWYNYCCVALLFSVTQVIDAYGELYLPSRNAAAETREHYRIDLRQMGEYLLSVGVKTINAVQRIHVEGFLADLDRLGVTNNTRRRKLAAVKSFFKFAEESGYRKGKPCR
jgi:Phage integrase, N-terminal SAM-like domain